MINNSIELAQILSVICTEQYTSTYYKIVQQIYDCFKAKNTLFIYVSPKRHGLALDFQTKLLNAQKNVKNSHFIMIVEFVTQFENNSSKEDVLLFLDKNDELLTIAKENDVCTLNLSEHNIATVINYTIPSNHPDRASEVQQVLLNGISDNCLKFIP